MKKFLLLVIFSFLVFSLFIRVPAFLTGNEGSYYFLTRAIVEEGSFRLDDYRNFDGALYENHLYSNKPPGLALIVAPFYWIFFHLFSKGFIPGAIFVSTFSALFAALTVGLVYLIARELNNSEEGSFFSALVTGFATLLFVYATCFMDHALSTLLVLLSIYSAFQYQKKDHMGFLIISSFCAGYLIFVHEIYALISLIILGYLLSEVRLKKKVKELFPALISFILPICALGLYRLLCFGSPLQSGNSPGICVDASYMPRPEIFSAFMNFSASGLYGLLFSPSRGLFIYSPILLFALLGVYSSFRRYRKETIFLGSIFGLHLLLVSCYIYWHGGHCFGSRYLIVVLPVLAIFLSFAFDRLLPKKRILFYTFFSYSVAVHAMLNYLWLPSQVGGHGKTWMVTESPKRLGNLFTDILPDFFWGPTANILGEKLFLGIKLISIGFIIFLSFQMVKVWKAKALVFSTLGIIFCVIGFNLLSGRALSVELSRAYLTCEEHMEQGKLYLAKKEYERAIEEFQEALRLRPREDVAHFYLGDIFGTIFDMDERTKRAYVAGYNNLGANYASEGNYRKAREMWEKALEIDPKNEIIQTNLRKLKDMDY